MEKRRFFMEHPLLVLILEILVILDVAVDSVVFFIVSIFCCIVMLSCSNFIMLSSRVLIWW